MPNKSVPRNPPSPQRQANVEAAAQRARLSQQASTSRRVLSRSSLPRRLIRPPPPATVDDPMYMYFMDVITRDLGAPALQSLARTFIAGPSCTGDLPSSLPVEADGDFPATHALAIPANERINVFPVHETILRAHCAALPPFPVVDDIPEDHIPVIYLSLPHPESYVPMSQYLYTHRQDVLFAALCPGIQAFGCTPFLSSTSQLRLNKDLVVSAAKMLRATRPVIESMRYIHGLWHNMVALGIHDDGMWEVVLLAYSLYAVAALLPSH